MGRVQANKRMEAVEGAAGLLQGELSTAVQSVSASTRCPPIHRDREINWTREAQAQQ